MPTALEWDEATPIAEDEWAAADPVSPESPELSEAIARGFTRGGTLGFADEFIGAARALGPKGGSGQDFANDAPIVEPAESYEAARDEERAANAAAQAAHPKATLAANVAGGGALAAGLPAFLASKGLGLGARMVSGAKAAAPVGAAYGLGESEADTLGGQALDTAVGGAGGFLLGGAAPVAGQALRSVAGPASRWLREAAVNQGRKVLTGNSGTISVKQKLPDEVIEEALRQGAIRPLGTTQKAAEVLGGARENVGERYAEIVAALEAKGVAGPNAAKLAGTLLAEADDVAAQTLGSPKPDVFRGIANELLGLEKGMHGVKRVAPKPLVGEGPGGDLALTQAENMKRGLQHEAATEYDKLLAKMRPTGEAKVAVASRVRQAIEDAIQEQAALAPDEAAAFEPVKAQLARIIEGSNAASEAAARASRNRGISLTDTIAGAAGMSSAGVPGAAAMAMANKVGRTRGPATASWLADKLSGATAPLAGGQMSPATQQAAEGSTLPALVEWLRARYGLTPSMAGAEEGAAP
jgi:hypothetical protein